MIIKIFKISTREMYTFQNKHELMLFVRKVIGWIPPSSFTINDLVKLLPQENYCRAK